ncbi:MAG: hypothetical protein ABSD32_18435, partial [Mycobacterium sp.]
CRPGGLIPGLNGLLAGFAGFQRLHDLRASGIAESLTSARGEYHVPHGRKLHFRNLPWRGAEMEEW